MNRPFNPLIKGAIREQLIRLGQLPSMPGQELPPIRNKGELVAAVRDLINELYEGYDRPANHRVWELVARVKRELESR